MPKPIALFLCTGNYYRSRYAEALFNHFANNASLSWQATSAGLRVPESLASNPGAISKHTLEALANRGITSQCVANTPKQVTSLDFDNAAITVAMCQREHLPMLEESYPDRIRKTTFWHVEDIEFKDPTAATAQIFNLVTLLIERISNEQKLVSS